MLPTPLSSRVTNPLDVIAMVALRESGFALKKVVGMAGVLDATRFCYFIAEELNLWPGDVKAMVMGGHGDTMVPLPRYTSAGGFPLTELTGRRKHRTACGADPKGRRGNRRVSEDRKCLLRPGSLGGEDGGSHCQR